MAWVPHDPAMVLVTLMLAAALLLVEVALPTFGVAGLSALALAAVATAARDQGDPWWPLLLVGAAACVWALRLAVRRTPVTGEVVAACLFALGSVGYGLLAHDAVTVGVAVAGSAALPAVFRPLLRATDRLADLPPQLGMEALVGRTGTVVRWRDGSGAVRVDGSLWGARSPLLLSPGTAVVIVGYDRMTVDLALPAPIT